MKVFISYAFGEGDAYAEWLARELAAAGCDVCWDGDLPTLNPSSIQEWMENQVNDSIVICIATPQYAERFGSGSDSLDRKGILYESRAIEQRLHDHTQSGDCPVIPVVPRDQVAGRLPNPLRRLLSTTISAEDGSGLEELLTRIRALDPAISTGEHPKLTDPAGVESGSSLKVGTGDAALRGLLSRLEEAQPGTSDALSLVNEWLGMAEASPLAITANFAKGFGDAEKVAKSAGDLDLMQRIADACLMAVRSSTPRLKSDLADEARVLVCGEGWYRQRTHQLQAALDSTSRGIDIAAKIGDRRTEAFGKKCLGRLERMTAEEQSNPVHAQSHLDQSRGLLEAARRMFFGIDGEDSDEAGDCWSLEGRSWLVHYGITGSAESLSRAKFCAARAGELIPPHNSKDYWDLVILNGELEAEDRHFAKAASLLREAMDRLGSNPDGPRSEILARALIAHASVVEKWRPRSAATEAIRDLEAAEDIYTQLGQEHSALECCWRQILIDPARVTRLQLGRGELEELAKQEPDPKLRIEALRELDAQETARVGISIGRRVKNVNWAATLRRVRVNSRRSER